jgi:hypothetical protein
MQQLVLSIHALTTISRRFAKRFFPLFASSATFVDITIRDAYRNWLISGTKTFFRTKPFHNPKWEKKFVALDPTIRVLHASPD